MSLLFLDEPFLPFLLNEAAYKRLRQSQEQENQKDEAALRKFLQASGRVDGKKSDHGPKTEKTFPEIQEQERRDESEQESIEITSAPELHQAIDRPKPCSSSI